MPATRIQWLMDDAHWSALHHIFGETTAIGVNEAKSEYDYNYKTEFQLWKENKEFFCQNILMSQPPLDSTHVGTKPLESNNVGTKPWD